MEWGSSLVWTNAMVDKVTREYLKLGYAENDKLFCSY